MLKLLLFLSLMSFDKGWNFRASSGFVTDGTNETYSLGEAYPTTRNGVTFGFGSDLSANARDRDSAVDRRLAGMDFQNNSTGAQDVFRVDVPAAGGYTVRLALGDSGSAGLCNPYIQVRDGSTALATIDHSGSSTVGTDMIDATGTTYSLANWSGSNTAITVTLTGTVLNFALGTPSVGTNLSMLAHVFVSQVASAAVLGYVGTRQTAPLQRGPFDKQGFLARAQWNYNVIAQTASSSFRRTLHPFGTSKGKRTSGK